MFELVYAGVEVKELCVKRFPQAIIEDASDEVHLDRFSVEMGGGIEEFYKFAAENGFAGCCLRVALQKVDQS